MREPIDARIILGGLFVLGYYVTLWVLGFRLIPVANVGLIKDALAQLGVPLGVIVGALFRSDRADEKRTENTAKAFDAITATAANTPSPPQEVQVVNKPGDPVPVETRP
jgi:hypothetical protein